MRALTLFLISCLVCIGSRAQDAANPTVEGFTPNVKWIYKTVGDVELKLHVFLPPDYKESDKRPALLMFFGGGWNGGSPSQFYPHCAYFAARGMVAVSAEYRVKNKHGTSPRECVTDGKSALRWLRKNASLHGIDPNRIVAGGGSAGGHVAAALATVTDFDDPSDPPDINCRPDGLVLFNPVFDNGPSGYGHDRVKDYWQKISPIHNITKTIPPTVVFLGSQDKLLPVPTAKKFQEQVIAKGGKCEVHVYEGQGHGFFNYTQKKNYLQTVKETDDFLVANGLLQAAPPL